MADLLQDYFKDQEDRQRRRTLVVKANIHQGHLAFQQYAGKQCTCNCLVFFMYAFTKSLESISAKCLDEILKDGSKLYSKYSRMHDQEFLLVKELEGSVPYHKQYFTMWIHSEHSGLCDSFSDMKAALDSALSSSSYIFVLLGEVTGVSYTSGLFVGRNSNMYIFDPHSRNQRGLPSQTGTAVLLSFEDRRNLHQYVLELARSVSAVHFEIVPVLLKLTTAGEYRKYCYKLVKSKQRKSMSDSERQTVRKRETSDRNRKRKQLRSDELEAIQQKDCSARKIARAELTPELRTKIKLKETFLRQSARAVLTPEIQTSIKLKNTSSRQRARTELSPEKRTGIRVKDTSTRQNARAKLSPETRTRIRLEETSSRQSARSVLTPEIRTKIKVKETSSRQSARAGLSPEIRTKIKVKDTSTRQSARSVLTPETRTKIKVKDTSTRQSARSVLTPETRTKIKVKETSSRQSARSVLTPETRTNIKLKDKSSRQSARAELTPEIRTKIKLKETSSRQSARSVLTPAEQHEIRQKDTESKRDKRESVASNFGLKFHKSIKDFAVYVCCCCHKLCYRQMVQIFSRSKYTDTNNRLLSNCITDKMSLDDQRYICSGCHLSLMKNKMPATAVANKLFIEDIPSELQDLRELECILIAQRIIFLKVVNLPRGGQKGLVGSFVNIPVDTVSVCASLPRTPEQSGIIPLKLKRKISYKGHHLHQNVRPDHVITALNWLIQHNPLYENVNLVTNWADQCQQGDNDLWTSLCEEHPSENEQHNTENTSENEEHDNEDNTEKQDSCKGNKEGPGTNTTQSSLRSETTQSRSEGEPEQQIKDSKGDKDNEHDTKAEDFQEKVRGVQYDTCLHPNNVISSSEKEYSIAPGEGKRPLDPFLDTRCEALAFPQLFPTGQWTLLEDDEDDKRAVQLTAKKYFIQRITNCDGRFASSIPYLFYALNVCEKQQVQNSINIALRKARRMDITVGELKNPDRVREIFVKDQAFQFLQQVRGSPSYWQRAQYELLAMVRARGVFTWFLTLSCADLNWPETIQAIAQQYGRTFSEEDVESFSYEEKCQWLRQNPVMAARQFDHRLQAFFRDVIQSDAAPLGKVTNYFQRTEFQLRGSPHCHAVLWVEDAPDLDTSSEEKICEWIDRYISCEIPSDDDPLYDEVTSKQQHSHSVACKKHGTVCRFHYPKPPSDKTLLTKPSDNNDTVTGVQLTADKVKEILSKVNDVLNDDNIPVAEMSLAQVLAIAGVSEDSYYKALTFSKSGKSVVLKRATSCLNTNNYNRDILKLWKANMDLQFVCDPYACITYIASYVTKDERELSQMLREAAKEMRDASVKSQLRKVGNVYLSNREISAQEAAYRLLSIPLKRCSSKMVWIPTDLPEDRIGILKPQSVLDELDDEDTDIYASGIVDRYMSRPDVIDGLCLWEFAAWYGPSSQVPTDELLVSSESTDNFPKILQLKEGKGLMKKYQKPAIPRYHVFSVNKESEKFYHQQLMLFIPWRDESKDLRNDTSEIPYEEMYELKMDTLLETKHLLEHHSMLVEEALRTYGIDGPAQHAWDMLDPEAEQHRVGDARIMEEDELREASSVEVSSRPVSLAVSTRPNALKDAQLRDIIHSLNSKQKLVFTQIISWCKDVVSAKTKEDTPDPFHWFVTGGAGTGKSQLIKAIYHQASRILQQPGDNPDYPVVLLTSPTGTAAYNIGGTTLHAVLHLPRGRYYSLKSNPSLLASFRLSMSQLKILVIDEMSMVGRTMLSHIHRRLQEAKGLEGTDSIFGGVSILAVGDFHQLPPVRQHKVFDYEVSNPDIVDPEELSVVLAGLWDKNFTMTELTEIMRQKEDRPFAELLNRVRTATHTDEDIKTFKSRIVSPSDQRFPHDALHIFATRAAVEHHNDTMLNQQTDAKIEIKSITKIPKVVTSYDTSQPVGGLSQTLTLCVNARIMLIKNLDVSDGLVNGATGKIVDIIQSSTQSLMPKAIIIQFDNKKIGRVARQSSKISLRNYGDGVPILPVEVKQHTGRSETSPEITRIQFPVVLCWACTIHKVQGATLDNIVISFKKVQTKGQAYVAVSRATSLQGLFLLDFNPDSIKADDTVLQEMTRLREETSPSRLDLETFSSLQPNIIRVCFFNVQGLGTVHRRDIEKDPYISTATILALSETWQQTDTIQLPGYSCSSGKARSSGHGGGAALLCKRDFLLNKIQVPVYNNIDAVAGEIPMCSSKSVKILLLYCPPCTPVSETKTCVRDFIDCHSGDNLVIGGDLNIDLNKTSSKVVKMLKDKGFTQISTGPSHNSGSHIDHIWTNLTPSPACLELWTYYSDHKQVFMGINRH